MPLHPIHFLLITIPQPWHPQSTSQSTSKSGNRSTLQTSHSFAHKRLFFGSRRYSSASNYQVSSHNLQNKQRVRIKNPQLRSSKKRVIKRHLKKIRLILKRSKNQNPHNNLLKNRPKYKLTLQ